MPDISPIGPASLGPVNHDLAGRRAADPPVERSPSDRLIDRVELSERAKYLDQLRELPAIRRTLVDRVRTEIQDGQYPTESQLDTAMQRLIEDLVD